MHIRSRHIKRTWHCTKSLISVVLSVLMLGGPANVPLLTSTASASTSERIIPVQSMLVARKGHTATVLADGRVLIAGGENTDGALSSAEIFDVEPGTFHAISPMTAARAGHTATRMIDGKLLIAGGDAAAGSAELFDPRTETFSSIGNMAQARAGHSATLFADNSVLLAGGGTDSAEFFDSATQAFTLEPQHLTASRTEHTAIATADEKLLLFGGEAGNTVERFDPATGSFTLAATLDA